MNQYIGETQIGGMNHKSIEPHSQSMNQFSDETQRKNM